MVVEGAAIRPRLHGDHHHDHRRTTSLRRCDRGRLGARHGSWHPRRHPGRRHTLAAGLLFTAFGRPIWLKLVVAAAFVAPAALAGFHVTHGIVEPLMPSDAWQITFSVIGAIAVGITAFVRVVGMAMAPARSGQDLARVWPSLSPSGRSGQQRSRLLPSSHVGAMGVCDADRR